MPDEEFEIKEEQETSGGQDEPEDGLEDLSQEELIEKIETLQKQVEKPAGKEDDMDPLISLLGYQPTLPPPPSAPVPKPAVKGEPKPKQTPSSRPSKVALQSKIEELENVIRSQQERMTTFETQRQLEELQRVHPDYKNHLAVAHEVAKRHPGLTASEAVALAKGIKVTNDQRNSLREKEKGAGALDLSDATVIQSVLDDKEIKKSTGGEKVAKIARKMKLNLKDLGF